MFELVARTTPVNCLRESRLRHASSQGSFSFFFFEWFKKFQDSLFSRLHRRYYTSANKVVKGPEADRKLEIFLTPADITLLKGEHDWSNILVIGEHKRNPDEDRSTAILVQLASYELEVFGSKPDWRFVLPGLRFAEASCGSGVFDRFGLYSSEKVHIYKELERFMKVITSYTLMSDAELGLNTFIKRDGNSKYIVAQDVRISF
jgi:hypothetical protein